MIHSSINEMESESESDSHLRFVIGRMIKKAQPMPDDALERVLKVAKEGGDWSREVGKIKAEYLKTPEGEKKFQDYLKK